MNQREKRVHDARVAKRKRNVADLLGDDPSDSDGGLEMRMAQVMQGVTLTWLHYVFKRDRITAKQLLTDCPVLRNTTGGMPVYDVAEAAAYLVKPKLDVVKLLGTMKESDLPDDLRPKIWQARLSRQRWEERAGNLWRGDAVMEVFAETFKSMREVMQLWADDIGEEMSLTEAQRKLIVSKVDDLQATLHKTLLGLSKTRQTRSTADEAQEALNVTEIRDAGGNDRRNGREHPAL